MYLFLQLITGYLIVDLYCELQRFSPVFTLFFRDLAPFLIVYSGGNVNFWTFDWCYADLEQLH